MWAGKLSLPRGVLSEPLPQPDPTLSRSSGSKPLRKLVSSESLLGACRTTRSVRGSLWNWSGTFYANHNGSPNENLKVLVV